MEVTHAPWANPPNATDTSMPVPTSLLGAASRATAPVPAAEPSTPSMPQVISEQTTTFRPATKAITSDKELKAFLKSDTTRDFLSFIMFLNQSIQGKAISDVAAKSDAVTKLLDVLDNLLQWIEEIPPQQQSLRYGNPAYRTWTARLRTEAEALVTSLLPDHLQSAKVELLPYLLDSFGNYTRIDYGTGHETTFCAFLFCLSRLGVYNAEDAPSLVAHVFNKYLKLMRKLQTTYWLEPAGSHGVWGLDDYQFLPFIWGASQLVGHPNMRPRSIHNDDVVGCFQEDYLYLQCVAFIKQVKKGLLSETSPYINDISGVPSWQKVNSGLIKMYQVEVLGKLPIMQHFLFGTLLPPPPKE